MYRTVLCVMQLTKIAKFLFGCQQLVCFRCILHCRSSEDEKCYLADGGDVRATSHRLRRAYINENYRNIYLAKKLKAKIFIMIVCTWYQVYEILLCDSCLPALFIRLRPMECPTFARIYKHRTGSHFKMSVVSAESHCEV